MFYKLPAAKVSLVEVQLFGKRTKASNFLKYAVKPQYKRKIRKPLVS